MQKLTFKRYDALTMTKLLRKGERVIQCIDNERPTKEKVDRFLIGTIGMCQFICPTDDTIRFIAVQPCRLTDDER